MKLGKCEAWNFGSYAHVEFDFSTAGLGLIYGSTGGGKSMLADLACWILYGTTAKNGAVDDVRSWQFPDKPTKGILNVQLSKGSISVTRIRGKSGQNDLYYTEEGIENQKRGKDLVDTQRLLSDRLGVDCDLYLSASYFCDFSPSGQFFVDKAKNRRDLFEKITSLCLPVKLAEEISERKKIIKKELEKLNTSLANVSGRLEQLSIYIQNIVYYRDYWADVCKADYDKLKQELETAQREFDILDINPDGLEKATDSALESIRETKVKLNSVISEYKTLSKMGSSCPTCHRLYDNDESRLKRLKYLKSLIDDQKRTLIEQDSKSLLLKEAVDKLLSVKKIKDKIVNFDDSNPYSDPANKAKEDAAEMSKAKLDLKNKINDFNLKESRLARLYDLSFQLRGELLRKAIKAIEISTNKYLEKYFDAEIRVNLNLEDSDDLHVIINKSGFECSFRQLSKGQRQLLKLCFAISVMQAAANSAGIHFSNLMFDEALDGLDDELKIKSFNLFSELALNHESILIIDHAPAFQNLFNNKYHITINSDLSSIKHE